MRVGLLLETPERVVGHTIGKVIRYLNRLIGRIALKVMIYVPGILYLIARKANLRDPIRLRDHEKTKQRYPNRLLAIDPRR